MGRQLPSVQAAEALQGATERIVNFAASRFYASHPNLKALEQCSNDCRTLIEALVFAVRTSNPLAYVESVRWLHVVLRARSESTHLSEMVVLLATEIRQTLGEQVWVHVDPLVNAAQAALNAPTVEHALYTLSPMSDLARTYLSAIIRGKHPLAQTMILDAYETGMPLREIYIQVLQPALYEVGRRWELNQLSVAEEHMASAITRTIMAVIYSEDTANTVIKRRDERAIVACLSGNRHEIGLHMLANLLQQAGYETLCTGADTPADSLLLLIDHHKPAVIGLSASLVSHVEPIRVLVEQIRSDFIYYRPTILLGGLPFNLIDGLWQETGGDIWAQDAGQALDRLTGG